jgi:hypothetical protein
MCDPRIRDPGIDPPFNSLNSWAWIQEATVHVLGSQDIPPFPIQDRRKVEVISCDWVCHISNDRIKWEPWTEDRWQATRQFVRCQKGDLNPNDGGQKQNELHSSLIDDNQNVNDLNNMLLSWPSCLSQPAIYFKLMVFLFI